MSLDRVNAHVNRLPEIEEVSQGIRIGRSSMSIMASSLPKSLRSTAFWSNTAHARRLLEHLSLCVQFHETPLLVGETGNRLSFQSPLHSAVVEMRDEYHSHRGRKDGCDPAISELAQCSAKCCEYEPTERSG